MKKVLIVAEGDRSLVEEEREKAQGLGFSVRNYTTSVFPEYAILTAPKL